MALTIGLEGWNAFHVKSRLLLERTLLSLKQQTYPLEHSQFIAVLDTQNPGYAETVREFFPDALVLYEDETTYYSAKNKVIDHATADIIVFVDSDVEYSAGWLVSLVECFDRPEIDFVVGNTLYSNGFLSWALDFSDWAAIAPASSYTDFFYANNFAIRKSACATFRLPERVGPLHGGAERLLKDWFSEHHTRPWFCKAALAFHHYYPFLRERLYVGAYNMNVRQLSRSSRFGWVDVPLLGPVAVIAGTAAKTWLRIWTCRSELPHNVWSMPVYAAAVAFSKSIEFIGALMYSVAPKLVTQRTRWFFS